MPEDGDIRSLDTEQAGEIEGDLFVDCTGFKALLIGETLGVPFKECGDVLFCDTALAVQVPYANEAGSDCLPHDFDRAIGGLDLGHRPAYTARYRSCLFESPYLG